MILFAAGDPGGARALLPLAAAFAREGFPMALVERGHFRKERDPAWRTLSVDEAFGCLRPGACRLLVFASSVADATALQLARAAKASGIPTLFVLDNWGGHIRRLSTDGLPPFIPSAYAVMDDLAREEAQAEGVPPERIVVTGHPDLAALGDLAGRPPDTGLLADLGLDPAVPALLFVSEPAAQDGGPDASHPGFRGYTQYQTLALACAAWAHARDALQVLVLPHPREDADALAAVWEARRGALRGAVVRVPRGRAALAAASGTAGMTSLLLYESWLLGKPTASVRPDARDDAGAALTAREGLLCARTSDHAPHVLRQLASDVLAGRQASPRPDLLRHAEAAASLQSLCKCLMSQP